MIYKSSILCIFKHKHPNNTQHFPCQRTLAVYLNILFTSRQFSERLRTPVSEGFSTAHGSLSVHREQRRPALSEQASHARCTL